MNVDRYYRVLIRIRQSGGENRHGCLPDVNHLFLLLVSV